MLLTNKSKIPYWFAIPDRDPIKVPAGESVALTSEQSQSLQDNEGYKQLLKSGELVIQDDSVLSPNGESISADSDSATEAATKPATKR